ncbi:MAG: phage holin [Acutalibacteraceae bacterium]
MKINIKARLKNKVFILSASALIISFVYRLLDVLGIVPGIAESEITELCAMAVNILAFFGVLVDPTTDGFNDSDRAMTYGTENDVRKTEESDQ